MQAAEDIYQGILGEQGQRITALRLERDELAQSLQLLRDAIDEALWCSATSDEVRCARLHEHVRRNACHDLRCRLDALLAPHGGKPATDAERLRRLEQALHSA